MRPAPDDSETNELIQEADTLAGALFEIAEKYGARVTNNEPRWQDGIYLRHIGDFIGDVTAAVDRFQVVDEATIRADERAKIAAAIRSDLGDQLVKAIPGTTADYYSHGMWRAAKIAEGAS